MAILLLELFCVALLLSRLSNVRSANRSSTLRIADAGRRAAHHSWCSNVDCAKPGVFLAPAQGMTSDQIAVCCANSTGTVNVPPHPVSSPDYPYGCCSVVSDPPTMEPLTADAYPASTSI